jgi:hypothetical protein
MALAVIDKIKLFDEIAYCVNMYASLNDFTFLPIDRKLAVQNLSLAVRRQKFIRVLKQDNQIVAWIYADVGNSLHMNEKVLQQQYYCSTLAGTKAFRAVQILHEELLKYAKENKYDIVFSNGSHMDEKYVFTRMLEKLGWQRRGYVAYKRPD